MKTLLAVFAASAVLCGPAHAQAPDDPRYAAPETTRGEVLDGEALMEFFSGQDRQGCYLDGRPAWHERTAADGRLFDLALPGAPEVGVWWVQDQLICYYYDHDATTGQGPDCFTAELTPDGFLEFFSNIDDGLVATTRCKDPAIT